MELGSYSCDRTFGWSRRCSYFHADDAFFYHVELASGGQGHIDDSAADVRSAIVDANDNGFVVAKVCDADGRAKGEPTMRGGEVIHVVAFTGRGLFTVVAVRVVGSDADFADCR